MRRDEGRRKRRCPSGARSRRGTRPTGSFAADTARACGAWTSAASSRLGQDDGWGPGHRRYRGCPGMARQRLTLRRSGEGHLDRATSDGARVAVGRHSDRSQAGVEQVRRSYRSSELMADDGASVGGGSGSATAAAPPLSKRGKYMSITVQVRSTGRTEEVDPAVEFSGRFLHLRYHINKDIHPSEIQRKWYGSEIRPRTLPSLLHYAMQVGWHCTITAADLPPDTPELLRRRPRRTFF
jgi:hypothetical protein